VTVSNIQYGVFQLMGGLLGWFWWFVVPIERLGARLGAWHLPSNHNYLWLFRHRQDWRHKSWSLTRIVVFQTPDLFLVLLLWFLFHDFIFSFSFYYFSRCCLSHTWLLSMALVFLEYTSPSSWSWRQVVNVERGQLYTFCVASSHVFCSTIHQGRVGSRSNNYVPCAIGTS
jgi:hypothetical protein